MPTVAAVPQSFSPRFEISLLQAQGTICRREIICPSGLWCLSSYILGGGPENSNHFNAKFNVLSGDPVQKAKPNSQIWNVNLLSLINLPSNNYMKETNPKQPWRQKHNFIFLLTTSFLIKKKKNNKLHFFGDREVFQSQS